jgi:hypothetical protein
MRMQPARPPDRRRQPALEVVLSNLPMPPAGVPRVGAGAVLPPLLEADPRDSTVGGGQTAGFTGGGGALDLIDLLGFAAKISGFAAEKGRNHS